MADTIAYQARVKFDSKKIHTSRYYRVKSDCILSSLYTSLYQAVFSYPVLVKLTSQSQVCIQVDTSILGNQPGFEPVYYWLCSSLLSPYLGPL